jgi:hypothetical protein
MAKPKKPGVTGRLTFRFEDGSSLEWSSSEPRTVDEVHELIDKWWSLNREPSDSGSDT